MPRPRAVKVFLSTPSARRATIPISSQDVAQTISIHALREEGDAGMTEQAATDLLFLSTPSARRATGRGICRSGESGISIHALREEGDSKTISILHGRTIFLSTPSARRATTGRGFLNT